MMEIGKGYPEVVALRVHTMILTNSQPLHIIRRSAKIKRITLLFTVSLSVFLLFVVIYMGLLSSLMWHTRNMGGSVP